jgi:hypothetical protein
MAALGFAGLAARGNLAGGRADFNDFFFAAFARFFVAGFFGMVR